MTLALFALMWKTDPRQAQHSTMITVNTKPVRHRFGKSSTEEVRARLITGGCGFLEGGHPHLLTWVMSRWYWGKCKCSVR